MPWGLSLLFSVFTTIAAVGSIFEYVGQNPVFGILQVRLYSLFLTKVAKTRCFECAFIVYS